MKTYVLSGSAMLRQLRKKRNLTLQHVASRFSTSVASLSRKERGVDEVNRQDIHNAIRVYHLSPAETAELWAAAGLLPDPPASAPAEIDIRVVAEPPLLNLLFPAFVLDALGYIKAWNQPFEYMWQFDGESQRPLHVISTVFNVRFRAMMGDEWRQTAVRFVNNFYRSTLPHSGHPNFARTIRMLELRHGADFIHLWDEAGRLATVAEPNAVSGLDGSRVVYRNGEQEIEFLVMRPSLSISAPYVLLLHVPFGPENHSRYEALVAEIGPQRVYFDE